MRLAAKSKLAGGLHVTPETRRASRRVSQAPAGFRHAWASSPSTLMNDEVRRDKSRLDHLCVQQISLNCRRALVRTHTHTHTTLELAYDSFPVGKNLHELDKAIHSCGSGHFVMQAAVMVRSEAVANMNPCFDSGACRYKHGRVIAKKDEQQRRPPPSRH